MSGSMRKGMWSALAPPGVVMFAVLLVLAAMAQADDGAQAGLRVVEKPEVRICYRKVPWSPPRVGKPGPAGATSVEPWAAATMDVRKPLTIGQTDLEPGCYAWVCTHDEHGHQVLELRQLQLPDGTLPDPEDVHPLSGQSLFFMPLRFDTSQGTTPHLTIELSPGKKGWRLRTRYGEGEAETILRKR